MDSFDRGFGFYKFMFALVFLVIIGSVLLKVGLITDAKRSNKTIYQIDVNNFNNFESYTTTEYDKDMNSGCIKFKDEFGIKHVICNNYSITEY